jgi:hypothetical protein
MHEVSCQALELSNRTHLPSTYTKYHHYCSCKHQSAATIARCHAYSLLRSSVATDSEWANDVEYVVGSIHQLSNHPILHCISNCLSIFKSCCIHVFTFCSPCTVSSSLICMSACTCLLVTMCFRICFSYTPTCPYFNVVNLLACCPNTLAVPAVLLACLNSPLSYTLAVHCLLDSAYYILILACMLMLAYILS